MRRPKTVVRAWVILVSVLPALFGTVNGTTARGDQIRTESGDYLGAKIVGLEGAELRFRTAGGHLLTAWIDEIKLILVDRGGVFDDFNQAERFFADGEPQRAIIRYRRSLRLSEGFWEDVILSRLVLACDAAGHPDTATLNLIRVLKGRWAGPAAAARIMPRNIPITPGRRVSRALEQLNATIPMTPGEASRSLLEILEYEILRQVGDERAKQPVRQIATMSSPPEARSRRVYETQLHALRAALGDGVDPELLASLDRAVRDCPESALPGLMLLRGETLMTTATTREDIVRASWPFLRVAIHFPDDPLAADGLYRAALALERLGREDKAVELLEECLGHEGLTDQTRQMAESARARLQPGNTEG